MDLESCIYNYDLNGSDGTIVGDNTIDSLTVGGVEYITGSPIVLGAPNVIVIGAYNYTTNFVDAINALDIPNFIAEYPSEADLAAVDGISEDTYSPRPQNSFRLTHEVGVDFLITISDHQTNPQPQIYIVGDSIVSLNGLDQNTYPWFFLKIGCVAG